MTEPEKQRILKLRNEGRSYQEIASALLLSENTIKSFFRRTKVQNKNEMCKNCGKKLNLLEKRKPKTFCSNNCRIAFWRKNRKGSGACAAESRAV